MIRGSKKSFSCLDERKQVAIELICISGWHAVWGPYLLPNRHLRFEQRPRFLHPKLHQVLMRSDTSEASHRLSCPKGERAQSLGGGPDNNLAYVNIVTSSPGFNPDNDSRMNKNLKLRSCEISQTNRRHISSRIRFRDLLFWISQNRTYGKVELIHPKRGPGNSRFTFRIDRAYGGMPTGRSISANRGSERSGSQSASTST